MLSDKRHDTFFHLLPWVCLEFLHCYCILLSFCPTMSQTAECTAWNSNNGYSHIQSFGTSTKQTSLKTSTSFVWSVQTWANTLAWKMGKNAASPVFLFFFFFLLTAVTETTREVVALHTFRTTNLMNLISEQYVGFGLFKTAWSIWNIFRECVQSDEIGSPKRSACGQWQTQYDSNNWPSSLSFSLQTSICHLPHCTGKIRGQIVSESKCRSFTMGWLLWSTTERRERMCERWRKRKGERGRWDWVRGRWTRFHSVAVLQSLFSLFLSSFITSWVWCLYSCYAAPLSPLYCLLTWHTTPFLIN